MTKYVVAAALGLGSLIIPFAASAQVGPVPVINALTAGIPYVTYGFGQAYGAPASAYYATDPWQQAYGQQYGGYGGYGGYYGNNYGYPSSYNTYGYAYPQGGAISQLYPSYYNYQPYYGNYNQPYMPNVRNASVGSMYGGYGNGGYGYF
jgi:hypothetical protein